mmetsp:Transcript_52201/g.113736  ORF Transcript_52201/g.113736 Transcript_52201/m.113736 type:complete len:89 (+) Transcript_52201:1256-1522(+)
MVTLFSHAARPRGAAATSAAANASALQSSTYAFVIFAEPTASSCSLDDADAEADVAAVATATQPRLTHRNLQFPLSNQICSKHVNVLL